MEMREGKVKCLSAAGFHHMAYVEWGDAENPRVLACFPFCLYWWFWYFWLAGRCLALRWPSVGPPAGSMSRQLAAQVLACFPWLRKR